MLNDNHLRMTFAYKYPDEAALLLFPAFGGGYLGGATKI